MPPNRFESEVESFLEGSHGDRTHIKRADHPRLHHYAGRYSAKATAVSTEARPAPAKAMTVSIPHEHERAKAAAVSTPHRHNRAKATAVSDKRAAWSAEPDHSARGQHRGLAGRPVGGRRYKRRQTNAIHIASRGSLLQTSSICVQKP